MCAWKRGTQNNLPGMIRKGHIKEFLVQSSSRDNLITGKLRILEYEQLCYSSQHIAPLSVTAASICTPDNGLPEQFRRYVLNGVLYLHSHEYPRSVLTAVLDDNVPYGSIILNQVQRINHKVCSGELQEWSIFAGDVLAYDCTEGSMGNHSKVYNTAAPPILQCICLEVSIYNDYGSDNGGSDIATLSCKTISMKYSASLYHCVVTTDDIYVVYMQGVPVVGRVVEVTPEQLRDDEFLLPDNYRGVVDESTNIYVIPSCHASSRAVFSDVQSIPKQPPMNDIVQILTLDGEVFPVKRKLLRPCIALTSLVQAGKGKYSRVLDGEVDPASDGVAAVEVDACTFDRVLLYLEHEARGDQFNFDPLLANELRAAALILGIAGLKDACDKVLGSFQERVRRTPIRLTEVFARNAAGGISGSDPNAKRRSETWLLMSGMVLDISRWLDEHPGGSTIIPDQALNVDCTVFFEIYHASRQSFLYLKEFYIGELALDDRPLVSYPHRVDLRGVGIDSHASDAFMEQLVKVTPWRLDIHSMASYKEVHQSF